MILKGMLACECLALQALQGVPFLGQTVLEIDAHHLGLVTLSRYHSPSEQLQNLQPAIMHIWNTHSLHVRINSSLIFIHYQHKKKHTLN